jgi:hypothetical protein
MMSFVRVDRGRHLPSWMKPIAFGIILINEVNHGGWHECKTHS